jgi:hypothetical protein
MTRIIRENHLRCAYDDEYAKLTHDLLVGGYSVQQVGFDPDANGGIGGAVGLTIADLIDPVYIVEAPITFVIKFLIGLLVGLVAHKLGHISTETDNKKVLRWVVLATIAGLAFNAIFDPLLRYFYKILILGKPAAEVSFAINFAVTLLNSVVSAVIVVVLYMALRAPLKKLGLFFRF